MIKFLKFMTFAAIVLVGYSMTKHRVNSERVIVGYDLVKARSLHNNGELVARTREIAEGELRYFEVEIAPEQWVACEKDCSDILRRKTIDRDLTIDERENL